MASPGPPHPQNCSKTPPQLLSLQSRPRAIADLPAPILPPLSSTLRAVWRAFPCPAPHSQMGGMRRGGALEPALLFAVSHRSSPTRPGPHGSSTHYQAVPRTRTFCICRIRQRRGASGAVLPHMAEPRPLRRVHAGWPDTATGQPDTAAARSASLACSVLLAWPPHKARPPCKAFTQGLHAPCAPPVRHRTPAASSRRHLALLSASHRAPIVPFLPKTGSPCAPREQVSPAVPQRGRLPSKAPALSQAASAPRGGFTATSNTVHG